MATLRILQETLSLLADAQLSMLNRSLEQMDDIDFRSIPTLTVSYEMKQLIESYGCFTSVARKDATAESGYKFIKIYCMFPSIFRIIENSK